MVGLVTNPQTNQLDQSTLLSDPIIRIVLNWLVGWRMDCPGNSEELNLNGIAPRNGCVRRNIFFLLDLQINRCASQSNAESGPCNV